MFRDDIQRARVCRTLLSTVSLDRLWTDDGPTDEALTILEKGAPLSSGQLLLVRVAWDVWNGEGRAQLGELLATLDTDKLSMVGRLLAADASGPDWIDAWLTTVRR